MPACGAFHDSVGGRSLWKTEGNSGGRTKRGHAYGASVPPAMVEAATQRMRSDGPVRSSQSPWTTRQFSTWMEPRFARKVCPRRESRDRMSHRSCERKGPIPLLHCATDYQLRERTIRKRRRPRNQILPQIVVAVMGLQVGVYTHVMPTRRD